MRREKQRWLRRPRELLEGEEITQESGSVESSRVEPNADRTRRDDGAGGAHQPHGSTASLNARKNSPYPGQRCPCHHGGAEPAAALVLGLTLQFPALSSLLQPCIVPTTRPGLLRV